MMFNFFGNLYFQYAFLVPASMLFGGGIITYFSLVPHPKELGRFVVDFTNMHIKYCVPCTPVNIEIDCSFKGEIQPKCYQHAWKTRTCP